MKPKQDEDTQQVYARGREILHRSALECTRRSWRTLNSELGMRVWGEIDFKLQISDFRFLGEVHHEGREEHEDGLIADYADT